MRPWLTLICFTALAPAPARAWFWEGGATLPHCKFLDVDVPKECRSEMPPDALDLIMPLADKMVKDRQIQQIKDYARNRMTAELDRTIQARQVLLDCMSKPETSGCSERIGNLKTSLEVVLNKLRLALALSQIPITVADHSLNRYVKLPTALGGAPLQPLNDEELNWARNFQSSSLAVLEKIGIASLKRELGIKLSDDDLRRHCHEFDPDYTQACQRLESIHSDSFLRFRQSMGKISDALISGMPFALRFSEVPITDDKLRGELALSQKTLQQWRKETSQKKGSAESDRLVEEAAFADEYVTEHPEACRAAEENIRSVNRWNLGTDVAVTGVKIVGMSTLCLVASPLVCFSVGSGMGALGVTTKAVEWNQAKARLSSSSEENPDANLVKVHDAFRDFLVVTALSAVGTTMSVNKTFLNPSALKSVAQDLEKNSGSFFGSFGDTFDQFMSNLVSGVKSTAISNSVMESADELIAKGETTHFSDWLRSDAFTARVFEQFVTSMPANKP